MTHACLAQRSTAGASLARRALAILTTVLCLSVSASAHAAPAVTFKTKALPIAKFPGTGYHLGAGAAAQVKVTISGSEYGGFPSPLIHMTFDTPAGTRITPSGFPTCSPQTLEVQGPEGCSTTSFAGPQGEGLGVVSFGSTRVNEKVSIQPFFSPEGLVFYVEGRSPAFFQIVEKASWTAAQPSFGPRLLIEVPLVETVPGADDASILSFNVTVGAAYKRNGKTISYITLPKKCPRTGMSLHSELKFASGEITPVSYHQPCPRR
jgi:hypothetical protein